MNWFYRLGHNTQGTIFLASIIAAVLAFLFLSTILVTAVNGAIVPSTYTAFCDGKAIAESDMRPYVLTGMFKYRENDVWKSRKMIPGETCWGEKHEVKNDE